MPDIASVIGCGGVGSNLAWLLARLGVAELALYDGDIFEPHNLANQACVREDIGRNKAESLAGRIGATFGCTVCPAPSFVIEPVPLRGAVFLCVDSMRDRKLIMDRSIMGNAAVPYAFDARMDAARCVVYSFDPHEEVLAGGWQHYWHPDDEAENQGAACGGSRPVSYTPVLAATLMAESFARWRDWKKGVGTMPPHLRWADLGTHAMHAEWWTT